MDGTHWFLLRDLSVYRPFSTVLVPDLDSPSPGGGICLLRGEYRDLSDS